MTLMPFWARRFLLVAGLVVSSLAIQTPAAFAHVDLAESTPAAGAAVVGPVSSIELTFTEEARPAGDGIQLLLAPDTPVASTVEQLSGTVLVLTPEQPLAQGSYAVGWSVAAGDAHPRTGVLAFSVVGEVAQEPAVDPEAPESIEVDSGLELPPAASTEDSSEPLEAFASLAIEESTAVADWLGRLARWLGLGGALFGIGALAFGAAVSLRSEQESRYAAFWVRRGGLAVLLSVPLELIAQAVLLNGGSFVEGFQIGSLSSALGGSFGWAMLLRATGGAGLLWGTSLTASVVRESQSIPADSPTVQGRVAVAARPNYRLDVSLSAMAVLGSLMLLLSYLFDGHTVTASPAPLIRLADLTHVGSGAIWVGGVGLMARTLASRHAAGTSLAAAPLVIRFSAIATIALVAVGISGLAMAWSILDGIGELFSTAWGRVLLAKLAVIGVAAGFGAFNHFVVLPLLASDDSDEDAGHLARRSTAIEAMVLVVAIGLTAVLVASAS